MSQPLARLNAAVKRFGKVTALDGFDLEVQRGELLALLGPNGAGKSTAISLLLGLQRPDSGMVTLFGEDPQELEARRRIGIMMQEVMLSPVMKSRELIEQITNYYPSPYDVRAVIERLEIQDLAERRYKDLSGGQKRQVQFAMAICGRPELLFLDEPTVGLDVNARGALWRVVRELVHEGASIVLTTHYIEEAEALADRVAVMAHGKMVAGGTVDEIRNYVSRKSVTFRSALPVERMRAWTGVLELESSAGRINIVTQDAESVLRQLLGADPDVRDVEVKRAGLAEAFAEITSDGRASQGKPS